MKTWLFGLVLIFAVVQGTLAASVFTVEEFKGDVEVRPPGEDWKQAATGMRLPQGTLISTGFNSTLTVRSINSSVRIKPLSQVSILENEIKPGGIHTRLKLRIGTIRAKVNRLDTKENAFFIETPSAVAGVRGTEEEVTYSPDRGTEVFLVTGSAVLGGTRKGNTIVRQRQTGKVGNDGSLNRPHDVLRDKLFTKTAPTGLTSDEHRSIRNNFSVPTFKPLSQTETTLNRAGLRRRILHRALRERDRLLKKHLLQDGLNDGDQPFTDPGITSEKINNVNKTE